MRDKTSLTGKPSGWAQTASADCKSQRGTIIQACYGHTRRVKLLRVVIPLFAGLLLSAYGISVRPVGVDAAFDDQFSFLKKSLAEVRMENPRYFGEDARGVPYRVQAEFATQSPGKPDVIDLKYPIALQNDRFQNVLAGVTASSGQFLTDKNMLHLDADVQLERRIGGSTYTLRTEKAKVELDQQKVRSTASVYGEGPQGSIRADQVTAHKDGRVTFEGNVAMRIFPTSVDKSERTIRNKG